MLIVALLAVSVMSSPDDRPPSHVAIAIAACVLMAALTIAAVFAVSVLIISIVIRLFRLRLTLGLVVFYLILLLNISGLYVAINAQWFRG